MCTGANLKLFGFGGSLTAFSFLLLTEVAVLLSSPVAWGGQQILLLNYVKC